MTKKKSKKKVDAILELPSLEVETVCGSEGFVQRQLRLRATGLTIKEAGVGIDFLLSRLEFIEKPIKEKKTVNDTAG